MRIPDITTLTQKWASEPNVEIQVFTNTDEALKELNLIFKESETFRPIILETSALFNPDITEEDVNKSKKPFKDFLEAKYGKYCVEEGALDLKELARNLLSWMSEADVEQFIEANDYPQVSGAFEPKEESEDEDED